MSIKTNEINIMSRKETDLIESKNRLLMEKIIKNWLKLQKIIKEEMTLEDIIFNHQEKEFVQLKEYFKKFYTLKLKNRQIFEEINNPQKKRNYLIDYDLKNIIDNKIPFNSWFLLNEEINFPKKVSSSKNSSIEVQHN